MASKRPPSEAPLPFAKPLRSERQRWDAVKREAEILNRAAMRSDVITRAAGRCELCRCPVPPGELHHVLSGSKRRRCERIDTLVFVCVPCHHAMHRSDEDTLRFAYSWANAHGFDEAKAAIMHRLEKLTEAKWASLRGVA